MSLPVLSKTIDDAFLQTWFDMKAELVDNILDATPVYAALRALGAIDTQVGSEYITKKISYAYKAPQRIGAGTTMQQSRTKSKTMAMYEWFFQGVDIVRTLVDDQRNAGPEKMVDYVNDEIADATSGLSQTLESDLFGFAAYCENHPNGLFDFVTVNDGTDDFDIDGIDCPAQTSGTLGNIDKSNSWWQSNILRSTNPDYNLISDMNTLYNNIWANRAGTERPDLIITTQELYEIYQSEIGERRSINDSNLVNTLSDLGIGACQFQGAVMIWSANMNKLVDTEDNPQNVMLFINTRYLGLVIDPGFWFEMLDWRTPVDGLEKVTYIVTCQNLVGSQPRSVGALVYADQS